MGREDARVSVFALAFWTPVLTGQYLHMQYNVVKEGSPEFREPESITRESNLSALCSWESFSIFQGYLLHKSVGVGRRSRVNAGSTLVARYLEIWATNGELSLILTAPGFSFWLHGVSSWASQFNVSQQTMQIPVAFCLRNSLLSLILCSVNSSHFSFPEFLSLSSHFNVTVACWG